MCMCLTDNILPFHNKHRLFATTKKNLEFVLQNLIQICCVLFFIFVCKSISLYPSILPSFKNNVKLKETRTSKVILFDQIYQKLTFS